MSCRTAVRRRSLHEALQKGIVEVLIERIFLQEIDASKFDIFDLVKYNGRIVSDNNCAYGLFFDSWQKRSNEQIAEYLEEHWNEYLMGDVYIRHLEWLSAFSWRRQDG